MLTDPSGVSNRKLVWPWSSRLTKWLVVIVTLPSLVLLALLGSVWVQDPQAIVGDALSGHESNEVRARLIVCGDRCAKALSRHLGGPRTSNAIVQLGQMGGPLARDELRLFAMRRSEASDDRVLAVRMIAASDPRNAAQVAIRLRRELPELTKFDFNESYDRLSNWDVIVNLMFRD